MRNAQQRRVERRRNEVGTVAVEFALIVPLLIMLVAGLLTTALVYNNAIAMSNAVREGARFGATAPTGADWATDVRDITAARDLANLPPNNVCVQLVQHPGTPVPGMGIGSGCGTEPPNPSSWEAGDCVVKVWATREALVDTLVMGAWDFNLERSAIARYERPAC